MNAFYLVQTVAEITGYLDLLSPSSHDLISLIRLRLRLRPNSLRPSLILSASPRPRPFPAQPQAMAFPPALESDAFGRYLALLAYYEY
jgi:hypothetical protein